MFYSMHYVCLFQTKMLFICVFLYKLNGYLPFNMTPKSIRQIDFQLLSFREVNLPLELHVAKVPLQGSLK